MNCWVTRFMFRQVEDVSTSLYVNSHPKEKQSFPSPNEDYSFQLVVGEFGPDDSSWPKRLSHRPKSKKASSIVFGSI